MRTREIIDAVLSHALATGCFEGVHGHEPKMKSPATDGVTCAVWVQDLRTIQSSGLATSSARLELTVRIYTSMLAEPQDEIDPRVVDAVDTLMAAYHTDFTLDGEVREIDLLGEHGDPLGARAGYVDQSGHLYRVMDLRLPLIVDDVWPQAA